MTVFVLVFAPVFTALFGILFAAVVGLRPPGLPLSVRVPQSHAGDAVVQLAIRRFRWGLLAAWVVTAAVTAVLALAGLEPLAAFIPVLLYAALSIVVLVLCRRIIVRAKREGAWFEGVPVRVTAQLTPPPAHHAPIVWPALAAIVLAVATGIDVALYPGLPPSVPVHYGLSGEADRWAAKSVWSVFGLLIIAAAVVALLAALSVVGARFSARIQADDSPAQSELRTQVQRSILTSLLSRLSFVIALGISAIEVTQRLLPGLPLLVAGCALGMVVVIMAVVIAGVMRGRRQLQPANVRDARAPRPDAVDDDDHWKGGLFYVNRDDPALIVPRRFGLGWTVNLGRPAGVALAVGLLAVIAVLVTTVILLSRIH